MDFHFRHATCNEVFEGWSFADTCRAVRKAGYDGIEIAPFTLNEYPASITQDERREHRKAMAGEGLAFVGLHWLMVSPKGLHVTTPDADLRTRSWQHIHDLIDLCADLADGARDADGNGPIMVFGSPFQRGTTGGIGRCQALENYARGLASVADHAERQGVTILAEALPSAQCDVMNTMGEAAGIVAGIGSPAIRTMFDTHNAADELAPHADLVDRYFDVIRHIHVNEMDGRCPGTGDYPFRPIFETLARRNYRGWISLEVFDFKPDPVSIVTRSLEYLKGIISE
jgi:sugar phosphate isomerase/epimerase